jgi:serine/threonine protein kinase
MRRGRSSQRKQRRLVHRCPRLHPPLQPNTSWRRGDRRQHSRSSRSRGDFVAAVRRFRANDGPCRLACLSLKRIPALLQQCLQRDPAQRINATDLADSLAALDTTPLLNQPLELPSPSQGYQSMPMFDIIRPALASATSDAEIRAKIDLAAAKCQSPAVKRLMRQRNLTQIEGQSLYKKIHL